MTNMADFVKFIWDGSPVEFIIFDPESRNLPCHRDNFSFIFMQKKISNYDL